MPSYRLTPAAQSDLQAIWTYSESTWGTPQAEAYINGIRDTVERLADDPELGRPMDDVRPGYLKQSVGSHFIVYRPSDDGIIVVRILHQRMDLKRHL